MHAHEPWSYIPSTTFLKFFVFWASYHFWSHFIIQNNVPALIFVVESGWQNVTSVELGSSLPDLPSSTLTWAGAVEVSVNRKSLKDPINVSAFTIFLLFKEEWNLKQGFWQHGKNWNYLGLHNFVTSKK